jgi:uncharacterized membrane protein YgcG
VVKGQEQQQTLATVIALLVVTEIVLHFCWKALDAYLFENFTVTTQIAIVAVILLLAVLFFREELVLSSLGGGNKGRGSGIGKKRGGVRNGVKKSRTPRKK